MGGKSLDVLRQLGQQLAQPTYDELDDIEKSELLYALGLNVNLYEKPPFEKYLEAVVLLFHAQEKARSNNILDDNLD